ncbi:MAG: ADP-ribosylglycohydrolase family protein [Caldilineaceae bacterium]|nr:ADP-ribosylglycohydrolase family protein [Caldilineaceae bacterium]
MSLPQDYVERVYAGVLGKIIGVYLGRPFEGWSHERIQRELGEVHYYVHEKLGVPLIVTDDDISGTFTFLRAVPDYGNSLDLTPAQIGQSWLNYLIERRTILWWGGLGNSTEHTAYMRLKQGIPAPQSGSIALNGKVVAEQIGAQIFIDGWAMVAPGDPALAVDLARRAGSVSHDGEAIYGAQVLAALESLAFVESDIDKLLDSAVQFIPHDSVIYRMIGDIRGWHANEPDWRKTREQIAARYGYDKYGGNCHMVPNHALIIHALLHGGGDFQRSLMIVNTCGWDTDCNSGNLGCLLGIRNGLAGLDLSGPDWRGPVADRMYLPTADGGRAITDAVQETFEVVNIGRVLAGEAPLTPKEGARFHFELPGAVQGFQPEESSEVRGVVTLENVMGHSEQGARSLAIHYRALAPGRAARAATPLFTPSVEVARYFSQRGYALLASPLLYPGQRVRAAVTADGTNVLPVRANLYLQVYGENDALTLVRGPEADLTPGSRELFEWTVPDSGGLPIASVGIEARSDTHANGTLYLDYLTWEGTPQVTFQRPAAAGEMWRHAWVNGIDQYEHRWPESFRLAQNEGRGLLMTGTRAWCDYTVQATVRPHLVKSGGIAARVQGMRRFYALLLCADGMVRLVKALDGDQVLAEAPLDWHFGGDYDLRLTVQGQMIVGFVDGREVVRVMDNERPLTGGGIALVVEEGRMATEAVRVE